MPTAAADVLLPSSRAEAIAAFGDGKGVTIVGGGTIVVPELTYGYLRPERVLLLARAGLDQIHREGKTVTIGAAATLAAVAEQAPEPLATAAQRVADLEIRGQATIGGNLCAAPGSESPRGDLQAPLLALDARVRSTGAGGERVEPVEEFLANGDGRLVLELELDEPETGSYESLRRPHAHSYTALAVACARTGDGVRVAVGGAGPTGRRCPSVEAALAAGEDSASAAAKAVDDLEFEDDALASAWYRRKLLPTLVARALENL